MRFTDFWYAEARPPLWARVSSRAYALGERLARKLYGPILKVGQASRPVISVGNLTVGGAGKTPVCLWLAEALRMAGHRPAILTRGYGRAKSAPKSLVVSRGAGPEAPPKITGDEPWLMAAVTRAPILADADRLRSAERAVTEFGADVLILDDGFQHHGLAADCRVLLIPSEKPFGNGFLLPAGPLREPLEGQRRAHILVETGAAAPSEFIRELAGARPVFAARRRPRRFRRLADSALFGLDEMRGQSVLAFCALGRPENFFQTLEELGLDVRAGKEFRDHQNYGDAELEELRKMFESNRAEFLVATAKDAVKIPADWPLAPRALILDIEMEFDRPKEFLEALLRHVQQA